jgi:hypothetical protein
MSQELTPTLVRAGLTLICYGAAISLFSLYYLVKPESYVPHPSVLLLEGSMWMIGLGAGLCFPFFRS